MTRRVVALAATLLAARPASSVHAAQAAPPTAGEAWSNPKDGLEYVFVPSGSFQMGCVPTDVHCDIGKEVPRHPVTLTRGFWLGRTEATVAAFRRFAKATRRDEPPKDNSPRHESLPVEHVSWDDAKAFCDWSGGRLPTEAQWEYAARAGRDGVIYVWGNDPVPVVGGRAQENVADSSLNRLRPGVLHIEGYDDGFAEASPVGSFAPNALGLHDLGGNVSEWVSDLYGATYYASSPRQDPRGPSAGETRVIRGGGFWMYPGNLNISNRDHNWTGFRMAGLGFRCARDAK
jgi:formylglycine-generating enzyme required for sulfatase activity